MKSYIVKSRLNSILKEREMSQGDLAKISGVPQPSISRFNTNQKYMATHLVMISRALGLNSIDDLFEIEEVEIEEQVKKKTFN